MKGKILLGICMILIVSGFFMTYYFDKEETIPINDTLIFLDIEKETISVGGDMALPIKEETTNKTIYSNTHTFLDKIGTNITVIDKLKIENIFEEKNNRLGDTIKHTINLTNKDSKTKTFDYSHKIKIPYDKVYWNGTDYYLDSKPQELRPYYYEGQLIAPNIFFGENNARINFYDISLVGGYALIYDNIIELRIDSISLKAGEELFIDPTYANATDGFQHQGADTAYLCNNGTNIFVWDGVGTNNIYMYSMSGTNLGVIFTQGTSGDYSMTCNDTAFFFFDDADQIYITDYLGNAKGDFDTNAAGCQKVSGMYSNGSDLIACDKDDDEIYWWHGDGTFITNWDTSGQSANCFGLAGNGTDVYNYDDTDWDVDRYVIVNSAHAEMIFDFKDLTGGTTIRGLTSNMSDFWGASNSEDFIYRVKCTNDCYEAPPSNTAPSIENIDDISRNEDFAEFTLDLTANISDAEDSDSALEISYTLNDTSVFTLAIVNSTDVLTFTSTANQSGVVNVSLTLIDTGDLTDFDSFDLIVSAVNDQPWWGDITDFTKDEDFTEFTIDWTANISDVETSDANLEISYTLNDTTLFSLAIVNTTSIATFTPIANKSGSINVSLILIDEGGLHTNTSFVYTINAINDVPWSGDGFFANITGIEDDPIIQNVVKIADINSNWTDVEDANPTTYEIISQNDTNVCTCAFDGSNNIDCTPIANGSGINVITFSANDSGGLSVKWDFQITLTAVNDLPWWDLIGNTTYSTPYFNTTDGFTASKDGKGNTLYVTNNGTDLFLLDLIHTNVLRYLMNTTFLSQFDFTSGNPYCIAMNKSVLYIYDEIDDIAKGFISSNGSYNSDCNIDVGTIWGTTRLNAMTAYEDELWAYDHNMNVIHHLKNGVNQSDYIDLTGIITLGEGHGLANNVTDLFLYEDSTGYIYRFYNGVNQTNSGFNIETLIGSVTGRGLTHNDSTFWLATDGGTYWVYNVQSTTLSDIYEDSGSQQVLEDYKIYFRDVEDDQDPSNPTISDNETDISCAYNGNAVDCTPSNNFTGDFIITLTVEDSGANSITQSFEGFVIAINDPPTVPIITPSVYTSNFSFNGSCSSSFDVEGDTIYYTFILDQNNPPSTVLQNSTLTTYSIENLSNGTYYFMCEATDGIGNSSPTAITTYDIDITAIWNYTLETVTPVSSGTNNQFFFNVTWNNLSNYIIDIDSTLEYNGQDYSMNETIIKNNTIRFATDTIAPIESSSESFLYRMDITYYNGSIGQEKTGNFTQTINEVIMALCNDTMVTPFINFTFKDEKNSSLVPASIPTSNFTYSINSDFSNSKSFTYSNSTENPSYAFCGTPNTTIYVSVDIDYENSNSPQKTWINSSIVTSNDTSNIILYLTSTATGQYVTFQVINPAGQPVSDVDVTVVRNNNLIESGATDDAGSITFFLNPDYTYTFTFTKTGFVTFTTTLKPTQSSYTISMATTEVISENINTDIVYTISPTNDVLDNETYYNFTFEIESGYFIIQDAGFVLVNGSATSQVISSASCSSDTGCSASSNISTGNYTNIQMNYYWKANDTYANGTRTWRVIKTSAFPGSFALFKRDLANLGEDFDDFTKALLTFFITLIIVGTLTYVSGQTSPLAILGEIFAVVFLLNQLNIVPAVGGIDNFIVFIVGAAFVLYALNESRRLL